MKLKILPLTLSVCKFANGASPAPDCDFYFISKTDEEYSLVCPSDRVPDGASGREDGWRAFRIEGTLDFSLVGILSKLSNVLAENGVGIFAVSTFNTDYLLVKEKDLERSVTALECAGYLFV